MTVVVDRFEDIFAVCECEDKTMINIEKDKLPADVCEGDVLVIEEDRITIDHEETERRKQEIETLMKDMWSE
ncbi:MAG: DUF3006 domain-containing protein [Clostridia bacterium]|nr:DUF3006 domain-containing protein [Clostridia bacterium]